MQYMNHASSRTAKYVTGGGMTHLTTNRVHLFHLEGNVPFKHRTEHKKSDNDDDYIVEPKQVCGSIVCMYDMLYDDML